MSLIKKEYKVLSDKTIEELCRDLNVHGDEGWSVILSTQEYGYTKVVLERQRNK